MNESPLLHLQPSELSSILNHPTDIDHAWNLLRAEHNKAAKAQTEAKLSPQTFAEWSTTIGLDRTQLTSLLERTHLAHYESLSKDTLHAIHKLKKRWGVSEWDLYLELGEGLMGSRRSITALLALANYYKTGDSMRNTMDAVHMERILRPCTGARSTSKDISALVPADTIKAADLVKTKQREANEAAEEDKQNPRTTKGILKRPRAAVEEVQDVQDTMPMMDERSQETDVKAKKRVKLAEPVEVQDVQSQVANLAKNFNERTPKEMHARQTKKVSIATPEVEHVQEATQMSIPGRRSTRLNTKTTSRSSKDDIPLVAKDMTASNVRTDTADVREESAPNLRDAREPAHVRRAASNGGDFLSHEQDGTSRRLRTYSRKGMKNKALESPKRTTVQVVIFSKSKPPKAEEHSRSNDDMVSEANSTINTSEVPEDPTPDISEDQIMDIPEDTIVVDTTGLKPVFSTPDPEPQPQPRSESITEQGGLKVGVSANISEPANTAKPTSTTLPDLGPEASYNEDVPDGSSSPFKYRKTSHYQLPSNQVKLDPVSPLIAVRTPSKRIRHSMSSPVKPILLSSGFKAGEIQETPPQKHSTSNVLGSPELGSSPPWVPQDRSEPPSPSLRSRSKRTSSAVSYDLQDFKVLMSGNISFSTKDLRTLDPGKWVNDEVINGHSSWLMEDRDSDVYVASTFLYERILKWLDKESELPKIEGNKVSIFDQKYSVLPIHQYGNHWSLAILANIPSLFSASPDIPSIYTIDSLDPIGTHSTQDICQTLKEFIYSSAASLPSKPTTTREIQWIHATAAPQQTNGFDCGIFMLMFLELFLDRPEAFLRMVVEQMDLKIPDARAKRKELREGFCRRVVSVLEANAARDDGVGEEEDGLLEVPPPKRETRSKGKRMAFLEKSPLRKNVQDPSGTNKKAKLSSRSPIPKSQKIVDEDNDTVLSPTGSQAQVFSTQSPVPKPPLHKLTSDGETTTDVSPSKGHLRTATIPFSKQSSLQKVREKRVDMDILLPTEDELERRTTSQSSSKESPLRKSNNDEVVIYNMRDLLSPGKHEVEIKITSQVPSKESLIPILKSHDVSNDGIPPSAEDKNEMASTSQPAIDKRPTSKPNTKVSVNNITELPSPGNHKLRSSSQTPATQGSIRTSRRISTDDNIMKHTSPAAKGELKTNVQPSVNRKATQDDVSNGEETPQVLDSAGVDLKTTIQPPANRCPARNPQDNAYDAGNEMDVPPQASNTKTSIPAADSQNESPDDEEMIDVMSIAKAAEGEGKTFLIRGSTPGSRGFGDEHKAEVLSAANTKTGSQVSEKRDLKRKRKRGVSDADGAAVSPSALKAQVENVPALVEEGSMTEAQRQLFSNRRHPSSPNLDSTNKVLSRNGSGKFSRPQSARSLASRTPDLPSARKSPNRVSDKSEVPPSTNTEKGIQAIPQAQAHPFSPPEGFRGGETAYRGFQSAALPLPAQNRDLPPSSMFPLDWKARNDGRGSSEANRNALLAALGVGFGNGNEEDERETRLLRNERDKRERESVGDKRRRLSLDNAALLLELRNQDAGGNKGESKPHNAQQKDPHTLPLPTSASTSTPPPSDYHGFSIPPPNPPSLTTRRLAKRKTSSARGDRQEGDKDRDGDVQNPGREGLENSFGKMQNREEDERERSQLHFSGSGLKSTPTPVLVSVPSAATLGYLDSKPEQVEPQLPIPKNLVGVKANTRHAESQKTRKTSREGEGVQTARGEVEKQNQNQRQGREFLPGVDVDGSDDWSDQGSGREETRGRDFDDSLTGSVNKNNRAWDGRLPPISDLLQHFTDFEANSPPSTKPRLENYLSQPTSLSQPAALSTPFRSKIPFLSQPPISSQGKAQEAPSTQVATLSQSSILNIPTSTPIPIPGIPAHLSAHLTSLTIVISHFESTIAGISVLKRGWERDLARLREEKEELERLMSESEGNKRKEGAEGEKERQRFDFLTRLKRRRVAEGKMLSREEEGELEALDRVLEGLFQEGEAKRETGRHGKAL